MSIRVVQLGSSRGRDEGIRIGTVRRPPRGIRKDDYSRLDYYDVWLPQLAPSAALVKLAKTGQEMPSIWKKFERQYRSELLAADNSRLVDLLSALSKGTNFSIGCYCANADKCHRSVLKAVLKGRGASIQ
jgi:uncharacterized protein YeaO (DUF488 family)